MKHNEILEIIKIFDNSNLESLEWEEDCSKLKLQKSLSNRCLIPRDLEINAHLPLSNASNSSPEEISSPHHEVKSPMIGNFYRSPSPDEKPFVEIGDHVKKGDVLCIIEAMKMLNEIKSDVNGVISDILVENGSIVDYGKTLFLIEE